MKKKPRKKRAPARRIAPPPPAKLAAALAPPAVSGIVRDRPRRNAPPIDAEAPRAGRQRMTRHVPLKGETHRAIRGEAGSYYIHDPERRAVDWWWENHYAQRGIGVDTMRNWARDDRWTQRRHDYIVRVESEASRRIASENVQAFVDDLKKLDLLYVGMADALVGDGIREVEIDGKLTKVLLVPPQFDSRAEMIRVLTLLDKRRDEKRKSVLAGLPAVAGALSDSDAGLLPQITQADARIMAQALLRAAAQLPVASPDGARDEEGDDA